MQHPSTAIPSLFFLLSLSNISVSMSLPNIYVSVHPNKTLQSKRRAAHLIHTQAAPCRGEVIAESGTEGFNEG